MHMRFEIPFLTLQEPTFTGNSLATEQGLANPSAFSLLATVIG